MSHPKALRGSAAPLIGVLPGEGCGPELTRHALDLLAAASPVMPGVEVGGMIGRRARSATGAALPDGVARFCRNIFERGGAILAGAAGDRFVYDARREFGLSAKLSPVHSFPELEDCGRWRAPPQDVDLIVARENLGGLYQGHVRESDSDDRVTTIAFSTRHAEIAELTALAARLAALRRGRMTLVTKRAGLPRLHHAWVTRAREAADAFDVALDVMDVDVAAYLLLREAETFDVIVTSNCFGDILCDLGGHIMGSRGNTYGASYSHAGTAVYQTNHGSAEDLEGTDRVNPAGQILSLAMLVREQFGWDEVAESLVDAVRATWRSGLVTPDLRAPGMKVVGTQEWMRATHRNLSERLACEPA
jgi:isocitrate/isopropylmalate dehydrogenase